MSVLFKAVWCLEVFCQRQWEMFYAMTYLKKKTNTHPHTPTHPQKKKKHITKTKTIRGKKAWRENRLLFQFIFWCLHVAPSKAGGAQRSPRRQCQRMLSPSKCTISLGDLCFLKLPLAGNTKSDWFVLSSSSFFFLSLFLPLCFLSFLAGVSF